LFAHNYIKNHRTVICETDSEKWNFALSNGVILIL